MKKLPYPLSAVQVEVRVCSFQSLCLVVWPLVVMCAAGLRPVVSTSYSKNPKSCGSLFSTVSAELMKGVVHGQHC